MSIDAESIRRMIREGVKVDDLIILGCYHKDIEAKKTDACYIMFFNLNLIWIVVFPRISKFRFRLQVNLIL